MSEVLNGAALDFEGWTCPLPLRDSPNIVMGHGGGGQMSAELIDHLFVPAFGAQPGAGSTDSAVIEIGGVRLAFSTDTFVVRPLFFPGGSIGHLAVNGTVNDLAMSGAVPSHLSCGFVLEEGTELSVVGRVAQDMGDAARVAGVQIVTGDTKVVDAGHGDQVYVNTAGVGLVPEGVDIRPDRATAGDVIISATSGCSAALSVIIWVPNSSPSRTLMIAMPCTPMSPLTMITSPAVARSGRMSTPSGTNPTPAVFTYT